jgi:hypothetical protein
MNNEWGAPHISAEKRLSAYPNPQNKAFGNPNTNSCQNQAGKQMERKQRGGLFSALFINPDSLKIKV